MTRTMVTKCRVVAFALACLAAGVLGAALGGCSGDGDGQAKPNIVLIQVDDQTLATFSRQSMPLTERLLARPGTKFKDYIVVTPQCCPSRSALLTGEYGHNNGITSNNPGYPDLRHPGNILPAWLQDAGYVTAHVGKYLNGYTKVLDPTEPPRGWDRWKTFYKRPRYFDFRLASRRGVKRYSHDYVTNVLGDAAERLIGELMPGDQPLYLQLDEHAPHIDPGRPPCSHSALPARRDTGDVDAVPFPKPPSFDESNVSDKPSFIRDLAPMGPDERASVEKHYRCAFVAMRAVDRSVADVYQAVQQTGELDDTVFIYISDNGYFYGEHRISHGKSLPYEEALRQPLVMRIPSRFLGGGSAVSSVTVPTANIDLAPTIVDLAGACATGGECRVMDGLSLLPPLEGGGSRFEHRPLLVEFDKAPLSEQGMCAYAGVREPGAVYIRYTRDVEPATGRCVPTDQRELYDLGSDPYERRNRYPAPPGSTLATTQRELEARLAELRDCAGIDGRDPKPPSGHYCG